MCVCLPLRIINSQERCSLLTICHKNFKVAEDQAPGHCSSHVCCGEVDIFPQNAPKGIYRSMLMWIDFIKRVCITLILLFLPVVFYYYFWLVHKRFAPEMKYATVFVTWQKESCFSQSLSFPHYFVVINLSMFNKVIKENPWICPHTNWNLIKSDARAWCLQAEWFRIYFICYIKCTTCKEARLDWYHAVSSWWSVQ